MKLDDGSNIMWTRKTTMPSSNRENSVKVSECKKYSVHEKTGSWAIIFFDEPSKTVAIHSDWGNWSYHWHNIGEQTLAEFLADCDEDYLMGKFSGRKNKFNFDKTVEAIKKDIVSQRRQGNIDGIKARIWFDEIDHIEYTDSLDVFCMHLQNSDMHEYDLCDAPLVEEYDNGISMFMKEIWPLFVNELKTN